MILPAHETQKQLALWCVRGKLSEKGLKTTALVTVSFPPRYNAILEPTKSRQISQFARTNLRIL